MPIVWLEPTVDLLAQGLLAHYLKVFYSEALLLTLENPHALYHMKI